MSQEKGEVLVVGSRYPLLYPMHVPSSGGASAQFLTDAGHYLQVLLPHAREDEILQITSGVVKAGLIVDGPLIYWLFKFGQDMEFDCPFDARIIPDASFNTSDLYEVEDRLLMTVHVVDTATGKLVGLRAITLPKALCQRFVVAAKLQRERKGSMQPTLQKYLSVPLAKLIKKHKMHRCGQ